MSLAIVAAHLECLPLAGALRQAGLQFAIEHDSSQALWDIRCGQQGSIAVIIASESDLLEEAVNGAIARRAAALCEPGHRFRNVLVVAMVSDATRATRSALEAQLLRDLRVCVIPAETDADAARQLRVLHMQDIQDERMRPPVEPSFHESALKSLREFPGLGEKKAVALLKQLGSLSAVGSATRSVLDEHIGAAAAGLTAFLDCPFPVPK
eukprot:m.16247 g.16247  ORF g.16247 m.16247 type:complete len:210 (+) comp3115_c0_seq2:67-696(+)